MRRRFLAGVFGLLLAILGLSEACSENVTDPDLAELETLMNAKVTSVTKTPQRFFDSAAPVFVISQQDIRRSSATNVAEVLRMVPGLHVARLDSNRWGITARGFNGRFANKMLVLLDGRTVYTPAFSGTYWETLDLVMTDIERIEVIRGPGASLWGANAVNGIINIITKSAGDTQGGLVGLTVGDEEKGILDLRYGTRIADQAYFRAYAKYARRDGLIDLNEGDAGDNWKFGRGGFRTDWTAADSNIFMLQGDIYYADLNRNFTLPSLSSLTGSERVLDNGTLDGGWLLSRWEQAQSLSSRTALQLYYQREQRDDLLGDYRLNTFDIDFQHEFALPEGQALIWGLKYRLHDDRFQDTPLIEFSSRQRDYNLFSIFIQDQVNLLENRLQITLGSKFERSSFTGWEIQPTLRALWKASLRNRLWIALSRAARTPSRVELDGVLNVIGIPADVIGPLPGRVFFTSNGALDTETLVTYELGYRTWPTDDFFLDITAFYNDYDDLRTAMLDAKGIELGSGVLNIPFLLINGEKANSYGLEVAVDWRPSAWWRMQLGYSFLRFNFDSKNGSDASLSPLEQAGNNRDPRHQLSLHSSFDIPYNLELDLWLRYVDQINDVFIPAVPGVIAVDDYLTLDIRLGWRPLPDLSISFVARNVGDTPHVEYLQEATGFITQAERGFYGQLEWRL